MEYERGPAAEQIRRAREQAGLPGDQIARALGITEESYDDLERYDDEVFQSLSVEQVCRLAELLRVQIEELLAVPPTGPLGRVSMPALLSAISSEIKRVREPIEAFENRVGWRIAAVLSNPEAAWRAWNLDALQDVCREVAVNWRAVLASWSERR